VRNGKPGLLGLLGGPLQGHGIKDVHELVQSESPSARRVHVLEGQQYVSKGCRKLMNKTSWKIIDRAYNA